MQCLNLFPALCVGPFKGNVKTLKDSKTNSSDNSVEYWYCLNPLQDPDVPGLVVKPDLKCNHSPKRIKMTLSKSLY